ncbi:MAG TPA: hypothetical protein VGR00_04565 [Thermoanaerobaculia bacterium]|nr:hypothetical protein [Thermoanaerobaculia bacterium]
MSYELKEAPEGPEIFVSAGDRESLYRDAISGVLEVVYGGPPRGEVEGQAVPIQAVGSDDKKILSDLVASLLEAVSSSSGRLRPPRWMAFDTDRVTANLPEETRPAGRSPIEIASVSTGDLSARLSLRRVDTH